MRFCSEELPASLSDRLVANLMRRSLFSDGITTVLGGKNPDLSPSPDFSWLEPGKDDGFL